MTDFKEKLRILFIPFLILVVCFVSVFTFLDWFLFIKTDFIHLKEDIVHFWLPFGLSGIAVMIWMRPRIKLLEFKSDRASTGYYLIATLAIAFPAIVAQEYLSSATGKLTQLENVDRYSRTDKTKYYTLRNFFVDKDNVGIENEATITGKYNNDLNFFIYVALPILKSETDTSDNDCSFFIGKKYSKTVSNSLSDQEKESEYKKFADKVQAEYDTTNFEKFVYLEKIGHSDDHDEFDKAVRKSKYISSGEPLIFQQRFESFESRNGDKFSWIFKAIGIGTVVWFIFLLFPGLDKAKYDAFRNGNTQKDSSLKEMLEFFTPKKEFFVTPIIMDLNILIYVIMVFSGLGLVSFSGENLLAWGGNFRPYTINGQWWRLLTNIFLHGGLMHIIANMYGLAIIGAILEPLLGRAIYLSVYLVTGLIASATSLWWHEATVSIGASGAIFGLYGFFLALLLLKVFSKEFSKAFLVSTLVFVGFNLLMGITGGIDNAAHIGGLLSGIVIGVMLSPKLREKAVEAI